MEDERRLTPETISFALSHSFWLSSFGNIAERGFTERVQTLIQREMPEEVGTEVERIEAFLITHGMEDVAITFQVMLVRLQKEPYFSSNPYGFMAESVGLGIAARYRSIIESLEAKGEE